MTGQTGAKTGTSATTLDEEAARLEQALLDMSSCEGASVALVRCPSAARERALLRVLAGRGRGRRSATSEVSLRGHGRETPDGLVGELLARLLPPGENRP